MSQSEEPKPEHGTAMVSDSAGIGDVKARGCFPENRKYQVKPGFLLREIAGESVIVPVDAESLITNAVMVPNDTAVFLWRGFQQPSTIEDVVQKGLAEYDVEEDVLRNSVESFVADALQYEILEGAE